MVNHKNSPVWLSPSGGVNNNHIKKPKGSAAANIKGCRRPHFLDCHLSEMIPTKGSEIASKTSAIKEDKPANSGSNPNT